jgi:GNAT superfamily N-acetyltransferase
MTPRIELHTGPRAELRALFELAEDSASELDAYLDAGRVLVALDGDRVVAHLQLIGDEVKNMAVLDSHRRRGIGLALLGAAVELARDAGHPLLRVATATADTDNLRFYQRAGFRMRAIERDAFTAETGYPPEIEIDGIPLRDRVWLDRPLA